MKSSLSKKESLHLIKNTKHLPTVPCVLMDIIAMSQNKLPTIDDLKSIIKKDQSISLTILKMANSPYYNRIHKVTTLKNAISRIGIDETINISMGVSLLYGVLSGNNKKQISKFWVQSYLTSKTAYFMAKKIDPQEKSIKHSEVFLTALFQSIGRVVLASSVDFLYFSDKMCKLNGKDIIELEETLYNINYIEAGKILLEEWGMPNSIIENINYCDFENEDELNIGHICCKASDWTFENLKDISSFEFASVEGCEMIKKTFG